MNCAAMLSHCTTFLEFLYARLVLIMVCRKLVDDIVYEVDCSMITISADNVDIGVFMSSVSVFTTS